MIEFVGCCDVSVHTLINMMSSKLGRICKPLRYDALKFIVFCDIRRRHFTVNRRL